MTRLVVALPSPRLQGGVAFVDTPGLGSLATSGATETLAYLPKCDLGVVLIDAGSTLTADDLQTILTLQEAAIPVNVLLSKADLLGPEDRARIVQYVKEHIASECKLDLAVHPVSVLPSCREMLDEWFENHILPLYARSQELRAASLRRKIGALRDSVTAALEARLEKRRPIRRPNPKTELRAAEDASSKNDRANRRNALALREVYRSGQREHARGNRGSIEALAAFLVDRQLRGGCAGTVGPRQRHAVRPAPGEETPEGNQQLLRTNSATTFDNVPRTWAFPTCPVKASSNRHPGYTRF